mmetsp:Transcript_4164/g.5536  ORF Transcript_4164/g.5536 Transcript_4164/m.5536 type:complete len:130 (-) Transcript_4164:493-882(-)
MSILAGAGRTSIYTTNGSGRDTYVAINNGGLRVSHQTNNKHVMPGTFGGRQAAIRTGREVQGHAKVPRYRQDGKGRDYFIYKSGGGFTNDYDSAGGVNEVHVKSLRSYPVATVGPSVPNHNGKRLISDY